MSQWTLGSMSFHPANKSLLGSAVSSWTHCSMRINSVTFSPWFHEVTVSHWVHGSKRPCCVRKAPWFQEISQYHNNLHGSAVSQWTIGSMWTQHDKMDSTSMGFPCATIETLFHEFAQCHSRLHGSVRSCHHQIPEIPEKDSITLIRC